MFVIDPSVSGTLMTGVTGQQDDYQFFLHIRNQKLHYDALQYDVVFAGVRTANSVLPETFQVSQNISTVEIIRIDGNSQMMTLATGSIAVQKFGSIKFTDI